MTRRAHCMHFLIYSENQRKLGIEIELRKERKGSGRRALKIN